MVTLPSKNRYAVSFPISGWLNPVDPIMNPISTIQQITGWWFQPL